jgi:predicted RNA-binding Zn ribbon-like protein
MAGQSAAEQHVGQAPGDLARLQAFVNTLDIEQGTEELASPQALAHWLEATGLLNSPATSSSAAPTPGETAPTAADLAMALELREALRGVLLSHVARPGGDAARGPSTPEDSTPEDSTPEDSADQLAGLRRISARLPTRLDVTADGRIGLAAAGTGVPAALARILLIAADSATLGTWPRLKVCSADDCRWAFYDRSPARSGCWCSMRLCGARAKSRAYRKRTAAPPASSPPR